MIDNMEISISPSFKLMGEPTLETDTHPYEKSDLLECQTFISNMIVHTVIENQKIISQQSSTDISPSTDISTSMDNPSTTIPSTDIPHPLTTSSSMDIPQLSMDIASTSTCVISEPNLQILSDFDTSIKEQIVISTLLALSEKEQLSERLGCSQKKGEVENEKHPIYSRVWQVRLRVPA